MRTLLNMLLAVALLAATNTTIIGVEPLTTNAKTYVNNMGGFGSYLAAAFREKGVPITVVMDRRQADFEVIGTSESKNPNWAEVIFLKRGRSSESATISVVNLRTAEVVFAYAYNGQAFNGKQSAAESCAQHLRDAIVKGEIVLGRAAGQDSDDADRPAGETTKVPPSEPGAAGAIPPEQLLMSVVVNSQPSNARVEVDGIWAGTTPVNVKLKAGTYRFKVFTLGFQPWTQTVLVEVGKAQTLGIALAEAKK
jgi:hypothetical protein